MGSNIKSSDICISCKNIKRGFPMAGQTFWALGGVTLAAERGRLTILRGRSGSGKTTLINILGALDYPTEGEIFFADRELSKLKDEKCNIVVM